LINVHLQFSSIIVAYFYCLFQMVVIVPGPVSLTDQFFFIVLSKKGMNADFRHRNKSIEFFYKNKSIYMKTHLELF